MYDVAIVGSGLFGSIIARSLSSLGQSVIIFDDNRPEAGSKPAACLMKPGWFSSMGKAVYDPALELLDELYRVQEIQFKMRLSGLKVKVFWVPPAKILNEKPVHATVDQLIWRGDCWEVGPDTAKVVIVAAGIWTELLVPEVKQKAQAGIAFLWPENKIAEPFIAPWAPYKQIVGFNRGDGLWISDGTTILRHKWTTSRMLKSEIRCSGATRATVGQHTRLFGIRPYHGQKPCYLEEVRPKLWVATGGAKNGTLAAAWCAYRLRREVG